MAVMTTHVFRLVRTPASNVVQASFAGRIPRLALRVLVEAVRRADEKVDPEALAMLCGQSRRTLSRRLREMGLPSPAGIIAWGKILASSWLLSDGGESLEAVALELGLGGSGALVHLYRRYLGLTPGEIRRRGGLAAAISLLQERSSMFIDGRPYAGERLGTELRHDSPSDDEMAR
jgi:AraC family transcriptional activator FtrA